jgi:hypothetical protein
MSIEQAIFWKHPGLEGIRTEDGIITEFPGGIPSQALQDTWTAEYDAYVLANAYKSKRQAEYAKLNQFEMQFDDQRDSTTTWVDAVNAIKVAIPKPS